ncbi:hypothetical protein QOT17_018507 [Balamuthia mandrillaris]
MDSGGTPDIDVSATPRVNKTFLNRYVGSAVRLVGVVKNKSPGKLIMGTSDGGEVMVHLKSDATHTSTTVEVLGTVNKDLTLTEISSTSFGEDFDLNNYNQLVNFAHQFTELFTQ